MDQPVVAPAGEEYAVWTYIVYLAVSLVVTAWVARTLRKNGQVFLVDAFSGNVPLATAVNELLVVGFYLINVGYVSFVMRFGTKPNSVQSAFEFFSWKIGMVLVILGIMHFFNMFVFSTMRGRAQHRNQPPPVRPDAVLEPARH